MINTRKIGYELKLIVGNLFINLFGVGLPIFLAFIICRIFESEMADAGELLRDAKTRVYLSYGTIIPLATVLMGYSSIRSNEIEKGIAERMKLFGISFKETICNRVIGQLIYISIGFAIFFLTGALTGALQAPAVSGAFAYCLIILGLTVVLFILAHGIATLCGKFGPTYFVSMALYFFVMFSGGLMGFSGDNLPAFMRYAGKLLPCTYVGESDFIGVWLGTGYNYAPLIQSFVFLAAVSGIVLFIAMMKENRD